MRIGITRARSKSNFARPYIERFTAFKTMHLPLYLATTIGGRQHCQNRRIILLERLSERF